MNLYSEAEDPKTFFKVTATVIISVSFVISLTVGFTAYAAFGNSSKAAILYNLPNEDPLAVVAQICYILTISGSYVLLIQPIFHVIE